jgi:exodeoxyribonuclease V alpha subunit
VRRPRQKIRRLAPNGLLQDQPYRLAEDIERIGFKTADKLALNLGFPTNCKERIDAGHSSHPPNLEDDGHTLGTHAAITEQALQLLRVEPALIQQRIHALCNEERLYSLQALNEKQELLGPACQRPSLAGAEKRIAEAIHRIDQTESTIPPIKLDAALKWAQEKAALQFAPQQTAALSQALQSKFSIITGGPGTGKTTILRAVVDILRAKRARIALASPTGRAAQRLSEAAGAPASTIHRLLKYDGASPWLYLRR